MGHVVKYQGVDKGVWLCIWLVLGAGPGWGLLMVPLGDK